MSLECSRSIPPSRLVFAVANPFAATPGPFRLRPTPSSVTWLEFVTCTPHVSLFAVVCDPETCATIPGLPDGLTFAIEIPSRPFPLTLRLRSTNDFVSCVPSMRTASPFALVIDHGPITYGSLLEPLPETTQWQLPKSPSVAIAMGAWAVPPAIAAPGHAARADATSSATTDERAIRATSSASARHACAGGAEHWETSHPTDTAILHHTLDRVKRSPPQQGLPHVLVSDLCNSL